MAAETAEKAGVNVPGEPSGDSDQPQPASRNKQWKLLGLLLSVMVVEAAVLYLWLPQPAAQGNGGDESRAADEAERITFDIETVEVPIGSDTFTCTNSKAAVGSVVHVTFKLHAIVSRREEAEFLQAFRNHEARVKQAVITVARSSNREDLDDPNLSTMKRLMREKINKVLKKSFVIEVVISEYKTMEQ